ncbi:DUF4345 domain-containing protein [uncultured Cocleimonas sp.]|uniref:DUF4345 domain-containing protein n=1 Tax=uncultured Cocleimonas sp. TaxID=1051587 RepID=UPI002619EDF7|nr:DUF4345 domain-containing protein [uncultured Cocleimonas sp.]
MKNLKVLKIVLFISGLIAAAIGGAIVVIPIAFYSTYSIELGGNVALLNEIRASGGALLVTGILIISGAFFTRMTFTSIVISTLLYLSYGLSRMLSMVIDGMPSEGFVQSAALEIVIGLVCVFYLVKYQARTKESM